jgi:adenylylsulfate kinase
MNDNIIEHQYLISKEDRQKQNSHKSHLIWFTGLSGSGKSTIANQLEKELFLKGIKTYTLDGDNIRKGINKDLTFSPEDRTENIRRIGEISKLLLDAGLVVIAVFISPYKKDRENVKNINKEFNFLEIFVNTSVEECERRDVKGLYKKARAGIIKNMTGISAPYEAPVNPDIEINTEIETVANSVQKILKILTPKLKFNHE